MEEPNKLSNRSGGVNIVEYKENVVPQSVDNMSDKKQENQENIRAPKAGEIS